MSSNSVIAFVYCGVAAVSAFIMIYNAQTVSKITPRYTIERYSYSAILTGGLAAIFDCAYTLRELEIVAFSTASSYILTQIYVICITLCGMFWVFYSEKMQNSYFVRSKKRMYIYSFPMILILAVVISTPFTRLYFYFDGIHYQRGPLFVITSTVLFLYVLQSGFTALVRSFKKENYVNRKEYRRLFAFAAVYIVIQIAQLTLPAIFPYRSVGTMIFFEIFLIQNMQELIGRDALTQINNRFMAERHLGTMFAGSNKFELVALDGDKFKSINDRFGHQEGDKALCYIASALISSTNNSCLFARMGGDEFVIINSDLNNSIKNIEEKMNHDISVLLKQHNCPYDFTVSSGYALKDDSVKSIPDLLELADKKLYERKAEKKKS